MSGANRASDHIEDNQRHWQNFAKPANKVSAIDPEGQQPPLLDPLRSLRCLHRDEEAATLDAALSIIRKNGQIDAVITMHSLHGETAQQRLPLDVVNTKVGNDVLPSSTLAP
jgi:hypothetical protein